MVSAQLFESYPVFPDDVPTARVAKISLSKLKAGDVPEALRMFKASRAVGFFLLNLKDEPTEERFIQTVSIMFGVTKQIFDMSFEEKAQYKTDGLLGYRAAGMAKTETGEPDKCEFFSVGQDDLLGNEPVRENPQVVFDNRQTMISYLGDADAIVQLILSILDAQLGLPKGKLSSLQRRDQISGTSARMIRYLPQVATDRRTSLVQHTDIGTLTLLSNVIGGLQILEQHSSNEDGNWRHVNPEPNCVIVNIGDALVQWTGGILRSNLHRVTFPPGEQASCTRYSIAYRALDGRSPASFRPTH